MLQKPLENSIKVNVVQEFKIGFNSNLCVRRKRISSGLFFSFISEVNIHKSVYSTLAYKVMW